MRNLIDEFPYNLPVQRTGRNSLAVIEDYLSRYWNTPALVLSSARTGYYSILNFFGIKRTDHVLIPDYMCQAILNITNTSGYPVKTADAKTKAVLVFHQWGYPQNMNIVLAEAKKRNLLVIEDCAHAIDSKYHGQAVGTFGEAAVFSLAKILTTYLGGVLISKNRGLIDFVEQERLAKDKLANRLFNKLARQIAKRSFERGKSRFWLDIIYLKSIHYPNLDQNTLNFLPHDLEELKQNLHRRRENYLWLRNSIKREYLIPDFEDGIEPNPLLVPVFLPEAKLIPAREGLLKSDILAAILHFDLNRNVFTPNYRKCLALPCHQQISQDKLRLMAKTVNVI